MKFFVTILFFAPLAVHAMAPSGLKTEFLENPLGLDTAKPRFSWIVEDDTPGAKQTTYQIQAASDASVSVGLKTAPALTGTPEWLPVAAADVLYQDLGTVELRETVLSSITGGEPVLFVRLSAVHSGY